MELHLTNILVFNDRKSKPKSLLIELDESTGFTHTFTSDTSEFELLLRQKYHDLLFLIIYEEPSTALQHVVLKAKNMAHVRESQIVALHAAYSSIGIKQTILLGARNIYLEPISNKRIIDDIKALIQGDNIYPPGAAAIQKLEPINCTIRVFGRIGRVYKDQPGDVQVESNLILREKQKVNLTSSIATDFGFSEFEYSAVKKSKNDIYFNFKNSYKLALNNSNLYKEKIQNWIKEKKDEFSFPKAKVLWITQKTLNEIEELFNDNLFSFYTKLPEKLDIFELERINPKAIVINTGSEKVYQTLNRWLTDFLPDKKILIQTVRSSKYNWQFIDISSATEFKKEFIEYTKPFLIEYVSEQIKSANHLHRKSRYSQCYFSSKGIINGASQHYVAVLSDLNAEKDALIQIYSPEIDENPEIGFCGKVVDSQNTLNGKKTLLTCQILPVSNNLNLPLPKLTRIITEQIKKPPLITEKFSQLKTKKTLKLSRRNLLIIGIILLLLLTAPYLFGLFIKDKDSVSINKISTMESVLRAIRKAFR